MNNNIIFKGIAPALVTPFNANGSIKRSVVKSLMDFQLGAGVKGFYICGSTGEGPILRMKTRMEMAETVKEAIQGRGAVIAHIGAPSIDDVVELTKHATELKLDAVSSLAPTFFFNYTDDELVYYYKIIADNTDLPIIVYATPAMKTNNITGLLKRIMEIPNVAGVKFTISDYFELGKIKEINGGNINVINGPDETLLCGLVMGADGGIGSTYNIMPDWFVGLYEAFEKGEIDKAREYQKKINSVIDILLRYGSGKVIKSIKSALGLMGYDVGNPALPAKMFNNLEIADFKNELIANGINI